MLATLTALTFAIWIAICAAAPEFIWQGLLVAFAHPSPAELASALLIGLVLACFVEPMMERARNLLHRSQQQEREHSRPRNALFTATLSLAFALVSVCIHDAIATFVTGRTTEHHGTDNALAEGLALATAWAIVPCAVTLAWLSVRIRLLAIPMGLVACASATIAGWLFAWSAKAVITTSIPSLLILALGYRQMRREPAQTAFTRCARVTAYAAVIWLVIALILGKAFELASIERFMPYTTTDFWTDVRFYIGWTLGLLLVPPLSSAYGTRATERTPGPVRRLP